MTEIKQQPITPAQPEIIDQHKHMTPGSQEFFERYGAVKAQINKRNHPRQGAKRGQRKNKAIRRGTIRKGVFKK